MDIKSLLAGVEEYTQRHLSHYIDELRHLCSIDSPSYYKQGLDEIACYLVERLRNLGMEAKAIERKDVGNDVFGILRGNGHGNVLLLGHTDTVYPVGTAAAKPIHMDGNTIYGPGVNDMRGGILAGIYAIEALLSMGFHSFGEVRFLCVSDEEISNRHCADILLQACQDCQRTLVLEAARENGDIVSARKGVTSYSLIVRGRSAHIDGNLDDGINAVLELNHQILQFQTLNQWREGLTINIGIIKGDTSRNTVPDFAQAEIDMRYIDSQDRIETEVQWENMIEHTLLKDAQVQLKKYITARSHPMVCTPNNLHLANQAQDIAHILGFSIDHVLTGGGSDGNWTSYYGIPSLDGLGPIGGLDHSPDEYLLLDSVAPRTALLSGLIATVGA